MIASCDCSYFRCDYEEPSIFRREMRRARKEHRCCECFRVILPGEEYEHDSGLWDGRWDRYKTCLGCSRIREAFCSSGCVYGELVEAVADCIGFYYTES